MFQAASQKAQNGHFQVTWNQQSNWTTHQVATTCTISPLSQHKHTCLHIEKKKKDTECVHTHHIYIYIIYNYYICYAAMHQIMYIYIHTSLFSWPRLTHPKSIPPDSWGMTKAARVTQQREPQFQGLMADMEKFGSCMPLEVKGE